MKITHSLRDQVTMQTIFAIVSLVITFALITLAAVSLHLYDAAISDAYSIFHGISEWHTNTLRDVIREYNRPHDPHIWVLNHTRHIMLHSPNTPIHISGPIHSGLLEKPIAAWRLVRNRGNKTYIVDWPLGPDLDVLRDLTVVLLFVSIGAIVVGVILGRWITRRVLEPVSRMTYTVNKMLQTNSYHSIRVPARKNDEFTQLAELLSQLITTLEERWQRDHVLLAEAAHQLRTPLEVIRGNLGLLQSWESIDRQLEEESFNAIDRAVTDMTDLVKDILTIEQAGSEISPQLTSISGEVLLEEVTEDAHALEPQKSIWYNIPSVNPWFLGNPPFARRALWAVLENALQYSPLQGTIRLRTLDNKDGKVGIAVHNEGEPIPPEELQHIFTRFYRGRHGRRITGTGLGLTIAKELMKSQKGDITVHSDQEGTEFILWFRAAPESH